MPSHSFTIRNGISKFILISVVFFALSAVNTTGHKADLYTVRNPLDPVSEWTAKRPSNWNSLRGFGKKSNWNSLRAFKRAPDSEWVALRNFKKRDTELSKMTED